MTPGQDSEDDERKISERNESESQGLPADAPLLRSKRPREVPRTLIDQAMPDLPDHEKLVIEPEQVAPPAPQRLPGGGYAIPRHAAANDGSATPVDAAPYDAATLKPAAYENVPIEQVPVAPHIPPVSPAISHASPVSAAPGQLPAPSAVPAQQAPTTLAEATRARKQKRKGITKTVMDLFVNIGNQLTGKEAEPESLYNDSQTSNNYSGAQDYGAENAYGTQDAYGEQQSADSAYGHQYGADERHDPNESMESREARIPKTLLDHSILFDLAEKTEARRANKAIEEAKERANEPVKPFIKVVAKKEASPCAFKWTDEESKDRIRYCTLCKNPVYNFAGLEMPEAEALIFKHESIENPTIYQREDGKYMSRDCAIQAKRKGTLVLAVVGGLMILVGIVGLMMMMPAPQPTKSAQGNSSDSSSSSSTSSYKSQTSPQHLPSGSSGFSITTHKPEPIESSVINTNAGANGGYGPRQAPGADDDWQWKFSGGGAQPPNSNVGSSVPAATPTITKPNPANEAAELERLRNNLKDDK